MGNLGLNSFFKASEQFPISIYGKDFDNNGNYDAVPTIYLPTSQEDPQKREFPVHVRDDMTKQLISFKSKFQNYKSYATATFDNMFTKEELKGVLKLRLTTSTIVLYEMKGTINSLWFHYRPRRNIPA